MEVHYLGDDTIQYGEVVCTPDSELLARDRLTVDAVDHLDAWHVYQGRALLYLPYRHLDDVACTTLCEQVSATMEAADLSLSVAFLSIPSTSNRYELLEVLRPRYVIPMYQWTRHAQSAQLIEFARQVMLRHLGVPKVLQPHQFLSL